MTERARTGLLAWLDAQPARPADDLIRDLSRGVAATAIGRTMLAQIPMPEGLACAAGCAFCCILPGEDGGTLTAYEARPMIRRSYVSRDATACKAIADGWPAPCRARQALRALLQPGPRGLPP
ncbi:hypothetical protein JSE7799_01635 [Jannaschia seosinensis]|uniref:Flagellin N-methylase n=1 Tax=Jannaschia seosinensis TaxID=313367 RepID=A0A0M7BCB5_9RHOB|nr:hypothetical protein [Jannaschia seosinensis]CUH38916.1 hypothetical protein JSE7799_01635 [Jannaschia seosinensis]